MVTDSIYCRQTEAAVDYLHITDIPVGILVDVASYLSKPSRALFAVAMSAPSPSWQNTNLVHLPSTISKAITAPSLQWEKLDFEYIEKSLAAKLSDEDIGAVLRCINAKHTLKRLKLAGCVNITGCGLVPSLKGSAVITQIDLSLAGKHECSNFITAKVKKCLLSSEIVLSILLSIVAADGCSLKHVTFPGKWRQLDSVTIIPGMRQFLQQYDQVCESRRLCCTKCVTIVSSAEETRYNTHWLSVAMYQENVCYDCLNQFCNECQTDEYAFSDERGRSLAFCNECGKDYCADCATMEQCCNVNADCHTSVSCRECMRKCDICGHFQCNDCPLKICSDCNKAICVDCTHSNCSECEKAICHGCSNRGTQNDIEHLHLQRFREGKAYSCEECHICNAGYCFDCSEKKDCWGCKKLVDTVKFRLENKNLRGEINELEEKLGIGGYEEKIGMVTG